MKTSITLSKCFKHITIGFVWICIWQLAYIAIGKEILFVSPFGVVKTLIQLCQTMEFWISVLSTLSRILSGYILAVIVGSGFGVLTGIVPWIYDFFRPILSVIKATPVVSFIILALIWLKSGTVPIFISFLMVFPIVWTSIAEGMKNVDEKLIEMSNIYAFDLLKKIRMIYIPSVLPYFKAASISGIGLAWKAGVSAEVLSNPKFSIGTHLFNAKIYLETTELFAWTTVVIILSIFLEYAVVKIIKKAGGQKT